MFHQTIVYGRCGRDPEVRFTASGQAVANFTVAVSEKRKGKNGEQQEHTTWYEVQAWSKLAELCGEFVHKGDLVLVTGRMNVRDWEDKDGGKRRAWELVAATVVFGKKRGGGAPSDQGGDREEPAYNPDDLEIPF